MCVGGGGGGVMVVCLGISSKMYPFKCLHVFVKRYKTKSEPLHYLLN